MRSRAKEKKRALELVSEVEKRVLEDKLDPYQVVHELLLVLYPLATASTNPAEQRLEDIRRRFIQRYRLNKRQMQALEMIAMGLSNEDISEVMELAVPTARYHIRMLFKNLGVRNRTSAARLWMEAQSEVREAS